jgi:V/A-type H+-transporting ATPase subunit C
MPQNSYEYAMGRVSILSTKMLKQNQLRRIAEAATVKEATAILVEAGYGEGNLTEEELAYGDLDLLIREQMNLTRKRILELTPDVELTGLFLLRVDTHNMKTLLKARMLGTDGEPYLRDGGFFPLELLKTCITTRKYDSLPKVYKNTFAKIEMDISRKNIDPMRFSAMLDGALFEYAKEVLDEKEEHGFIREYFNVRSDFQNALSLVRARLLHWGPEKLRMLLLDCGEIDKKYFLESMDTPLEQLGARLSHGSHGLELAAALNDYVQRKDIAAIADCMRHMLMEILRKVRWDYDTLGPVIGYLKARDAEAQALRVIFGSKQGGFEAPLPQLYI